MPDHTYFANLIWQIADLLRGPCAALITAAVIGQLDIPEAGA